MFRGPLLAGLAAFIIYFALIEPLQLFHLPELKTQDLFFKIRARFLPKPAILDDFILVALDDESFKNLDGKWPFKRKIYADMLERINQAKPKLVAFDFIFQAKGEPTSEFLLTEAIKKSGRVVLASLVDPEGNYVTSRKAIREAAQGSGIVNKVLDKDYDVRRVRIDYRDQSGNRVAWPWEVEILKQLRGLKNTPVQTAAKNIQINYQFGFDDVERVSLSNVISDPKTAARTNDKIVIVGATTQTLHDFYHTPMGFMPGVIINMNFLVNLLTGDFLKELPKSLQALLLAILTFFTSLFGFRFNVVKGLILTVAATIAAAFVYLGLFVVDYTAACFTALALAWASFLGISFYRSFITFIENAQLRGKVVTDPLTGLYNRRALESRIDEELEKLAQVKGERRGDPFSELSLLMLDIDNFKHINDTFGHQFGDDVLKNVAYAVSESIRSDDLAARYGGEEFCVVLPHTSKERAVQTGEKIRSAVEAIKLSYVSKITHFTLSVGVAASKEDGLFASRALIKAADDALYEAKRTGKNKVVTYRRL